MNSSKGNLKKTKIAIIGSGIGALAAAAKLSYLGYEVSVFEQSATFGGKAGEKYLGQFRFDTGPSLFTLPSYIDEVFEFCNKDPRKYYSYHQLKTICNYFYSDGTIINAYSDIEKFAKEIELKTKDNSKAVKLAYRKSKEIYDITADLFLQKSLHKFKTYLSKSAFKGYLKLHKIGAFKSMNEANSKLFKDDKNIRLFNRYATYNGSNPFKAPSTLNIIPFIEFGLGGYLPEGGIRAIPKALYQLNLELGTQFIFNSKVESIALKNNKVIGIKSNNTFLPFDKVISNADIHPTYKNLLKDYPSPHKILNQPRSTSALIFYWGINKNFHELDCHNILFSDDYKLEFDLLDSGEKISDDPTVYIHISSKVLSHDAPINSENWFVMVNAPFANGTQNWGQIIEETKRNIISKINKVLKTQIENHIVEEDVLSPQMIESKTSSYGGSLYGSSSNNRFAAFLRHPNFSAIKNLYFVGGSVHPGGGIPLVTASAKICVDIIQND